MVLVLPVYALDYRGEGQIRLVELASVTGEVVTGEVVIEIGFCAMKTFPPFGT
jgi:hypothetical protein